MVKVEPAAIVVVPGVLQLPVSHEKALFRKVCVPAIKPPFTLKLVQVAVPSTESVPASSSARPGPTAVAVEPFAKVPPACRRSEPPVTLTALELLNGT